MMFNCVFDRIVAHKRRKVLGRGIGSGHGKTCSRGHKGASSRSGFKVRLMFEGGQTPIPRRVAKNGFSNGRHKSVLAAVSVEQISRVHSSPKSKLKSRRYAHKIICSRRDGLVESRADYSAKLISKRAFALITNSGASLNFID